MITSGYSLTLFKNVFDNKTHKGMNFSSWESFEKLLYDLSEKPGQKGISNVNNNNSSPLISPATYTPDSTRANKNVIDWGGWACIDVDNHDFRDGQLERRLYERYGHFKYICYSTASSREDYPKFRLVFRLSDRVRSGDIKHFWFALNTEFDNIGDRQTKDLSRMYYVPAIYPNAYNFIFSNEGESINPKELMDKHYFQEQTNDNKAFFDRLPKEVQKQIIQYKQDQMSDDFKKIEWKSYQDCPFWPKKLASEYMVITNTGWYHKMYQIMVSVSSSAIRRKYPINPEEIATLCREFDNDTGKWYKNRPLEKEAERALEFVYKSN